MNESYGSVNNQGRWACVNRQNCTWNLSLKFIEVRIFCYLMPVIGKNMISWFYAYVEHIEITRSHSSQWSKKKSCNWNIKTHYLRFKHFIITITDDPSPFYKYKQFNLLEIPPLRTFGSASAFYFIKTCKSSFITVDNYYWWSQSLLNRFGWEIYAFQR
jgi:hypothetical protein